jgi:hypothetical protein
MAGTYHLRRARGDIEHPCKVLSDSHEAGLDRLGRHANNDRDVLDRQFLPCAKSEKLAVDWSEFGDGCEKLTLLKVAYDLDVCARNVNGWDR